MRESDEASAGSSRFTRHIPRLKTIQVTLQENCRRHFIHVRFPLAAADVALNEQAIGLGGSQPFVPGLDRDRDGAFEGINEFLDFEGGRTIATAETARQADQDQLDLLFAEQLVEPRQKIREGPGGDEFERLGNHLQLVAEGDAHSFGSMINCQDAHEGNFTAKPSKEKYDSLDTRSQLQ